MTQRSVVNLLAGRKSSGQPVHEEVLVDRLAPSQYRIVASPGLVLGVAAGDVIETTNDLGDFRVLSRGGNLALQLHGDNCLVDEHLSELSELTHAVDARAPNITVLTIPVRLGFSRIESVLNGFVGAHPGIKWFFGNVYDPSDGVTPLNWWKE